MVFTDLVIHTRYAAQCKQCQPSPGVHPLFTCSKLEIINWVFGNIKARFTGLISQQYPFSDTQNDIHWCIPASDISNVYTQCSHSLCMPVCSKVEIIFIKLDSNFGKDIQLVRVPWKCVSLVWLLSWQPDTLEAFFLPETFFLLEDIPQNFCGSPV